MKTCSKEMRILLSRFPLRYHIICMIIHHIIHQLLTIMNSLFFDTLLSSYTCLRKLFYRLLNRFFCQRTHDSKILFFFFQINLFSVQKQVFINMLPCKRKTAPLLLRQPSEGVRTGFYILQPFTCIKLIASILNVFISLSKLFSIV